MASSREGTELILRFFFVKPSREDGYTYYYDSEDEVTVMMCTEGVVHILKKYRKLSTLQEGDVKDSNHGLFGNKV